MDSDKTATKKLIVKTSLMAIGLHMIYKFYEFSGLSTALFDLLEEPDVIPEDNDLGRNTF